jgi:hypothetical protein
MIGDRSLWLTDVGAYREIRTRVRAHEPSVEGCAARLRRRAEQLVLLHRGFVRDVAREEFAGVPVPDVRHGARRAAIDLFAQVLEHAEHMDYAKNAAQGVPIGSGSVESLCSQFQNRLKRTGQFWSKTGFAAILRVTVRHWNREMDPLWPAIAA